MSNKIDVTNTSPAYWDKVLRQEKLSMDEGRDPSHEKDHYSVGNSFNVEAIHEMLIGRESGRVRPKGHGPDQFEIGD